MLRSRFLHPCHVSHVCLPFMGLCACTFDASLSVWLHLFPFCGLCGCNHVLRVHLSDVALLATCLSLICAAAIMGCCSWVNGKNEGPLLG